MEEAVCKESLLKKRAEILAESAGKPLQTRRGTSWRHEYVHYILTAAA